MSYFVIGDEETVTGFRLAGVEGRVARTAYEAREALSVAQATDGVDIIVITQRLAVDIKTDLKRLYAMNFPLVINIPDRKGPAGRRLSIRELVKSAVGIKI